MYPYNKGVTQDVTAESVTEGHPDKMADLISDAVLDALLAEDPESRVAVESFLTTGTIIVAGEVTSNAYVDVQEIAREVVRAIGYTDPAYGFAADSCGVWPSIHGQSPDIARGVDGERGNAKPEDVGAGDQGMMFGFACDETPEFMPLPIALAHQLARRLATVRKNGSLPYLRPDGKTQVTLRYEGGKAVRAQTVLVSTQHNPDVSQERIREDIIQQVIAPILPPELFRHMGRGNIHVNPTGRFVIGGPQGDTGLTGRKIIVDTYGGACPHGGGAFSGKDPTKVDRSGAYAARWVAKNIVAAGLASIAEVQVSYAIGIARPLSVAVDTFDTGIVPDDMLADAVLNVFDLRPGMIIARLHLTDRDEVSYQSVASYGHFGRTDLDLPWERTDMTGELRTYLRL